MTLESVSISERTFDRLRLPDDALLKTAKRHEETLYKINIAPLVKHTSLSEEFLYWFKHLFLMTFFYDYCLDRSNEEQFPEALFISANMFADYRDFVNHQYGSQGLTTLNCNNAYQVRYQILEKQWLHPSEYFKNFPDYSCYYKKQLLCLTHLQLLALNPNTAILANTLIEICKEYWSCVLLIDDIMDAKQDIETQTLTPLIVRYWHCYESMPTEHDIHVLMQDGDQELGYLVEKIDRLAFKTGFFDFMDNIYFLVDKARQASA